MQLLDPAENDDVTGRCRFHAAPLESVEALEAVDTSDIQLDQAMRVVADMAALAGGSAWPGTP